MRKRMKNKFGRLMTSVIIVLIIIFVLAVLPTKPQTTDDKKNDNNTDTAVSSFSVLFIDVGQGDSALVECDGHYMLIDGGNKADSDLIYTVLKDRNIDHLDIVVGTHADEDHIGGLAGALNFAKADIVLCPVLSYESKAFKNFAKYADQNGNGIKVPKVGETYQLGSAQIEILAVNTAKESNDTSIVLKIQYGETTFLFVGDAEEDTEKFLTDSDIDVSATVLKVGHHGADTSTNEEFLKKVSPKYAVISVGENNNYGHPSADILMRLKNTGAIVYRTDMQGDIYCSSDGTKVTFETEKNSESEVLDITSVPNQNIKPEQQIYSYVVNTNTMKFHYSNCTGVDDMSESNKAYFTGTRYEAIANGYTPCGKCRP